MTTAGTRQRRLAGVTVALILILAVAGCSAPDESSGDGAPIQINTADGPVTIHGTPKRIVALGAAWIDATLAFGVTPVGYLDNIEVLTGKPAPWAGERLKDAEAIGTEDIVGHVAKAKPDLVLATSYMAKGQPDTYKKIAAIAPTIPGVSGKQIDPWQDLVTFLGAVLRKPDKAKEITASVEGKIEALRTGLPGLRGKTYTIAYLYSSDQIQVLGDPDDGATHLFRSLGMSIPRALVTEFRRSGEPRYPVSTERVPMLDSNLLAITANTDQLMASLSRLPGYRNLTSVRRQAISRLTVAEIGGLNEPTPLSIPYLIDKMRPAFERAAN